MFDAVYIMVTFIGTTVTPVQSLNPAHTVLWTDKIACEQAAKEWYPGQDVVCWKVDGMGK